MHVQLSLWMQLLPVLGAGCHCRGPGHRHFEALTRGGGCRRPAPEAASPVLRPSCTCLPFSIGLSVCDRSQVEDATICTIICDRGDRYLSTGVYNEAAMLRDPRPCPVKEWPSAEARLEVAYPGPHFVVFTSDCVDGTGEPWCSDCARTLPAIRSAVRTSPTARIFTCASRETDD